MLYKKTWNVIVQEQWRSINSTLQCPLQRQTEKYVTAHANTTMEVHPTHHADEINMHSKVIHKQIQKFLIADLTTTYRFDQIEVDVLVSEINPQLWSFMKSITRSISERRGYDVKANKMHTSPYHIHKIRCLFCLCVLMFCTDDRCSDSNFKQTRSMCFCCYIS